MYPADYRYTKEHEWVKIDGDTAVVGITHHAQDQLGDVVFVELPAKGSKVHASQSFGTVESVKAVSDIYAPLSGEVAEINEELVDAPETLNADPHGKGWRSNCTARKTAAAATATSAKRRSSRTDPSGHTAITVE